ncbi:hypothetical protein MKZ15_11955 [Paenibacillus sp. FSL R7-0216]
MSCCGNHNHDGNHHADGKYHPILAIAAHMPIVAFPADADDE